LALAAVLDSYASLCVRAEASRAGLLP
jgi:hypothetical protein